ncbi:MAG: hypothetical protein KIT73_15735, partial [Burkholderiales bacterium]|nr:hypothetical protein [Burkholderiales bacterium]
MNIDLIAAKAWMWVRTLEIHYQAAFGVAALLGVLGLIVFLVVLWQALALAVTRGYTATVNAIPYM